MMTLLVGTSILVGLSFNGLNVYVVCISQSLGDSNSKFLLPMLEFSIEQVYPNILRLFMRKSL